jgi:hypothetical protein
MSAAAAKTATGTTLDDVPGSECGFGWSLSARFDGDALYSFGMTATYGNAETWLKELARVWGPGIETEQGPRWIHAQGGWLVQGSRSGDTLAFYPMTPVAGILAKSGPSSALALIQSLIAKPKATLAHLPGYDAKGERFVAASTECGIASSRVEVMFDDKDAVTGATVGFDCDVEGKASELEKQVVAAYGPFKAPDDRDEKVATTDGLKIAMRSDDRSVTLTFTK